MARKIRTTKSPEERRAEAEGLHATIAEQVEELRSYRKPGPGSSRSPRRSTATASTTCC